MITNEEFLRIAGHIKAGYGIDMTEKKVIMNGRLENFVWRQGYRNFTEFMDAVESDVTGALETKLVDMLTTNHTFFMRESEHFEYMKDTVIPWIREREASTHDMRIWCGAASSGEEPYTIAMLLMDAMGLESTRWDTTVLATDLDEEVLGKAVAGVYDSERISALPDNWKRRYFRYHADTDTYEANSELKEHVIFRKFNLMNSFPFRKPMHAVFMRNVMIYFDEPTKAELIRKIYDVLLPGGYLFVGRTETLTRSNTEFVMIQPSIFRRPLDS